MQKRFGSLRAIGTILKVLGIIDAVVAVGGAIAIMILASLIPGQFQVGGYLVELGSTAILAGIALGVIFLFSFALMAVVLIAFGETLQLFVAVEENTRATVILLQAQNK
jgi:hypothetical protein